MKKYVIILAMVGLMFAFSWGAEAGTLQDHFQVLEEYELVEHKSWGWQMVDQYQELVDEITLYSSEYHNLFLDLVDTLYKYGQAEGHDWKRYDLHKLAWAIKDFHNEMMEVEDFHLTYGTQMGMEMEVIHAYGTGWYLNPYQHDLDEDGQDDIYDEDEYIRQYVDLQVGFTNPRMDGAVNLRSALNYFGTGYQQDQGQYDKQLDQLFPEITNLSFSFYGPHFSATVGEDQILGLREYVYYDDPTNPDDGALSGIVFQAPYGIFFGLGQETWANHIEPEKSRDVRWIAVGTEGLGYLPFGFYLTEQEFQDPLFHKVGRNVVFSLNTDLENEYGKLSGDLAVNDSGDGYYLQANGETTFSGVHLTAAAEWAEHFTPIQPKVGFANTEYDRFFKGGEVWTFPARTERGFAVHADYRVLEELQVYGDYQQYLTANDLQIGMDYQPLTGLEVGVKGKYDLQRGVNPTLWMGSTYEHQYGQIETGAWMGTTGLESIEVEARPKYENSQVTVTGIFGYSLSATENLQNSETGILIEYHPIKDFTFIADYRIEDKQFDADLTGQNFTRNGSIEYQINPWAKAHITFENIEFRGKPSYLVEYTDGGIEIAF